MNKCARNAFALDGRHVTGNALASGAAIFVVRVFFERGGVWAVRRRWSMTIQTDLVCGLSELSIVLRAMHVMARRPKRLPTPKAWW
jgi:hypothetical protein